MTRILFACYVWLGIFSLIGYSTTAFTLNMEGSSAQTRRSFFANAFTFVGTSTFFSQQAKATPEIFTTPNGIKYAIITPAKEKTRPRDRDIVAIEYTGYLTDGTIFDSTHAEGKKNALMFSVGGSAVIEGINEMVKEMGIGEKVQAIIPPSLAFGEKGVCLDDGNCLIKPNSSLVYDISLKRSAIPPP